jgi:hypothetical protein
VLLDFGDVIVHIFAAEQRSFYRLEDLWADAQTLLAIRSSASGGNDKVGRKPASTGRARGSPCEFDDERVAGHARASARSSSVPRSAGLPVRSRAHSFSNATRSLVVGLLQVFGRRLSEAEREELRFELLLQ